MSTDTVVVTGLGVVTPLGRTVDTFWEALVAGESAARAWDDLAAAGFRIPVACRVAGFDAPAGERGQRMAIAAAGEAVAMADHPLSGRTGLYVGTTMGESARFERAAEGHPFDLTCAAANSFARAVRGALRLRGPARTYGTACAAGNYAIGAGAEALRQGHVEAALVGGVDPFSRIAMVGFSRARAMSADRCRPFDRERSGMQLGEGAAFLLLERAESARRRGARPLATIGPLGLTGDAYHPTAPLPDGSGMAAAMENALARAGLSPADVGWICAHGSGTRASDAAEATAIRRVFGPTPPPVSGLKGALGHALGAATAIEAVATVLALHHHILPPTATVREVDPDCGLDVVTEPRAAPRLRWALNCGFAFGGLNAALLIGAA